MGKEILQKHTIFEVKRHLAEMEKQYSKERVAEMLGENRTMEIGSEVQKSCCRTVGAVLERHSGIRTRQLLDAPAHTYQIHILRSQRRMCCAKTRFTGHRGRYASRYSCIL